MQPTSLATPVFLWLLLGTLSAAWAAPNAGPCAQDMTQFCHDVQPELGGMIGCLKVNEAKLTNACRSHQQQVRAKLDGALGMCKDDAAQLCKGVTGKGRMHVCLRSNEVALSDACRQHLRGGVPAGK